MAITVSPIKSFIWWPASHILQELMKTIEPRLANSDTSAPVILELVVVLVGASLDHVPPTCMSLFQAWTYSLGHTLDWKYNEDAAKELGEEIAHAVESHQQEHISLDSGHLTAHQKENFQTQDLEVIEST